MGEQAMIGVISKLLETVVAQSAQAAEITKAIIGKTNAAAFANPNPTQYVTPVNPLIPREPLEISNDDREHDNDDGFESVGP